MLASLIITTRDEDPEILETTLAGLGHTTRHLATETILVDDGSSIPVSCGHDQVRLIRNPIPKGVCPARRIGAQIAEGDVLIWMDAHMSFGEGWLEQMLVHAQSGALLCSPFWTYDLHDCMCWGANFAWNGSRDYYAQKYPGFGLIHRTERPSGSIAAVPMIIGACYAMQRASYLAMGGFSPHFRVWGIDEQDMSARAWIAGFGVACVTEARVGHLSRNAFPYPVQYEHLEFNQLAMIRTLFEKDTVERLQEQFDPVPETVQNWLDSTDLNNWRQRVQSCRRWSDSEFFACFAPELTTGDPASPQQVPS